MSMSCVHVPALCACKHACEYMIHIIMSLIYLMLTVILVFPISNLDVITAIYQVDVVAIGCI